MTTTTKTYTDSLSSSPQSTWVFKTTWQNALSIGSSSTFTIPATSVEITRTQKAYGAGAAQHYVYYGSNTHYCEVLLTSWASGSTKTASSSSTTRNVSSFFNSNNPTDRTYSISVTAGYQASSWASATSMTSSNSVEAWGVSLGSLVLTLNAPPTVEHGDPTYATPHYTGCGAYTVSGIGAEAYYGGTIASIKLAIGADSVVQNYSSATVTEQTLSLTPTQAGTFTPTIIVTDSRGQVTTVNLDPIIVNIYNVPNVSFDIQRCTDIGKLDVEGEFGLVSARISYTSAIANLTQPTIIVQDEDGTTITSSAIWYTSWTAQSGVQNAVNWTNYHPQSPITLYGVISATGSVLSPSKSYIISVTPTDSLGKVATTITQTLPPSFFTIDFKAGGKEIAFGAPANDDLTDVNGKDYSEIGLFKCEMGTNFNDMTQTELDALVSSVIGGNSQYDSGWINITPVSPFRAYQASSVNAYRRVGKVVTVVGEVQPTGTLPADTTPRTIYTLPEGFRPIYNTSALMYGSSGYSWNLLIYPDGQVTCSRHRNGGTYVALESWMWLPFYATFIVAD